MDIQIRANGTRVTDGMREFIDRRMSKLDRLADQVTDAVLELKTETLRSGAEETTAQITLRTGKHLIRAEAEDAEPAKAIDMAVDKLIAQVRKFTDKRTSKRRRAGKPGLVEATPAVNDGAGLPENVDFGNLPEDALNASLVARTKSFQMDPMDVDMAIEQMELIGHDFFFFKNQEDEKFSVLYRRRDGTYGILSPE
ncbi:MAG TPA: ribosome-associated translation inhibitor RaiA [Thermomicrobiales bacterium]|nr:ribosome-associated translation inhibitor RaiA [Thermomicrobiales bacterium]